MRSRSRFEFQVWGEQHDDVAASHRTLSDVRRTGGSSPTFVIAVGVDDVRPKVPTRVGDRAGDR
jgi:hypothetical protein